MGFFNFRKKLNKRNSNKKSKQVFSLDQHLPYQSDILCDPYPKNYIDSLKPPDSSLMSDIMNELNQGSAFNTIVTPSDVTEKNPAVEQQQQQSAHDGDFHRTALMKRPLSFNNNNPTKPIMMHKSKSTFVKLNDIPNDDDDNKPILKRHSAIEQLRTSPQNNRLSKNPIDRMKERHRQEVRISLQQPVNSNAQPKAKMGISPSMPIIYSPDNRVSYQNYSDGIVRSASFATNPFGQQTNYHQQPRKQQQHPQTYVQPWSDIVVSNQSHLRYSMIDPRLSIAPLAHHRNNSGKGRIIKSASALTIQEQPKLETPPIVTRRPLYYERKIPPPSLFLPPPTLVSSLKCRRISPECCHQRDTPPSKTIAPVHIESCHYQSSSTLNDFPSPPSPTSPTSTKYSFKQQEIKFKLPKKLKRELESMQIRRSTYSVPDLSEFQKQYQDDIKRKKKTFWQSIEPCHHHHHHHHYHRTDMKKSNSDQVQKSHCHYHHQHCHVTNNNNNQLMT
ncbi:hypothetical protein K501DRAFT_330754 [Backusella circina FSU 941]|nr:hypothetical protein K501DRAFT_330754 [Backusella circina FSU 941]